MTSLKNRFEPGQNTIAASRNQLPASAVPVRGTQVLVTVSGLLLGMLLAALDQTIVGTALPTMFRELGGSLSSYPWAFTACLLTSTVTIPIYGKLADLWGRKWFFMGGIVVFLFGSALAGAAQTPTQLILFRGLQGIGPTGCATRLLKSSSQIGWAKIGENWMLALISGGRTSRRGSERSNM